MFIPIITIDGPSGVGKGTVSLQIAKHLGWHLLDSGVLYRALALEVLSHQGEPSDETHLVHLATSLEVNFEVPADFSEPKVLMNGQEVTQALRTEECAQLTSQIAALPLVRQALLEKQKAYWQAPGLVAEGRDMGTIVFPQAPIKIFLTATCEERAQRRYKQLREKGIKVDITGLIAQIKERDQRDSTRTVAPLTVAKEALVIDTTGMKIENVVASVLKKVSHDLNIRSPSKL